MRSMLLCMSLCFAVLFASTFAQAAGDGLYDLCPPDKRGDPASVCSKYVSQHFSTKADSIQRLLDGIDFRKDQARDLANADYRWLIGTQWTLVVLGAIATVMISLSKLGQVDLRRWAILPSAIITMVSAMAGFYDFSQSHRDNTEAKNSFAFLLDQLQIDLISAVEADEVTQRITDDFIDKYYARLDRAVQNRKDDFLAHVSKQDSKTTGTGEKPQ